MPFWVLKSRLDAAREIIKRQDDTIAILDDKIWRLRAENENLERQLADKEIELERTRKRHDQFKDAYKWNHTVLSILDGQAFVDDVERHRLAWVKRYGPYALTWVEMQQYKPLTQQDIEAIEKCSEMPGKVVRCEDWGAW